MRSDEQSSFSRNTIHLGMSAALLLGLVAATASTLPVAVTGDCPSADAVAAALGSALGNEAKSGATDVARVTDLGERFSVAVLGQTQTYADPRRDCEERARAAAVFIALALNPPSLPALPPPPPPREVVVAPPPPPPEPARWFALGVAARADGGPALAFGAELRADAGGRWLGLAATAGVLAPTESTFSSVTVRQQRFPLSLSLTARHQLSERLTLGGAVGAALVPLTLRGQGLDASQRETRLDAGFRLAVSLWLRATPRLVPFLELHAELFPRPYELVVEPLGDVGSTGRLWVGVAAGLAFEALPR